MAVNITLSDVEGAILSILQGADNGGLLVPQQVLGIEEGEAPDVFRSEADENQIHAWIFYRTTARVRRTGDVAYTTTHAQRTRRADKTWSFEFKGYFGYETGSNLASARKNLDSLLDTIQDAFFKQPKLGLNNENLRQHDDWQVITIKMQQAGDLKVFIVTARMDVQVYKSIAP